MYREKERPPPCGRAAQGRAASAPPARLAAPPRPVPPFPSPGNTAEPKSRPRRPWVLKRRPSGLCFRCFTPSPNGVFPGRKRIPPSPVSPQRVLLGSRRPGVGTRSLLPAPLPVERTPRARGRRRGARKAAGPCPAAAGARGLVSCGPSRPGHPPSSSGRVGSGPSKGWGCPASPKPPPLGLLPGWIWVEPPFTVPNPVSPLRSRSTVRTRQDGAFLDFANPLLAAGNPLWEAPSASSEPSVRFPG